MAIESIISQPDAGGVSAAYRPVILRVSATATNGDPVPPVVYCDIYFDNVFYKTISKSQYDTASGSASEWEFDIQDAAQEYLGKYIGENGGQSILAATPLALLAKCKFRSSGIDTEGFIQPEGTVPVQGTGDTSPSAGTGTESDEFFIVNATLQHEDNQNLADHLNAFKQRIWDDTTYPLTHRPDRYKVCAQDSDYFPILSDKVPARVRLHYVPKGGTDFIDEDADVACIPVSMTNANLPNAAANAAYEFRLPLSGSGPFSISGSPTKPDWMDISVDGDDLVFSGTPETGDAGLHISVNVTLQNCSGDNTASYSKFINVTICIPVSFSDFVLPSARADSPYSFSVPLTGSAPYTLDITSKPSWMNISASGTSLVFSGSPTSADVDTGVPVQLNISNCGGDGEDIAKTIDVLASENFMLKAAYNMSIDSVTGTGVPALGATGTNGQKKGHQTGMFGNYDVVVTGTPVLLSTHLDLFINGSLAKTIAFTAADTYTFTSITASETDVVSFFVNS